MHRALAAWLDPLWRTGDPVAATLAAAEAVAHDPWAVVSQAGLLARCGLATADRDLGLTATLRVVRPDAPQAVARIPAGAPYPVTVHAGRRRKGAYDTPRDLAHRLVGATLAAAEHPRSGLDPACGTGAFLLALAEAGLPELHGSDLDPLALEVARIAVPTARLARADGLLPGASADVVVGNPPFVPPERQDKALRADLRHRFPWLRGRFDLAVPFAAAAVERAGQAAGLVLPSPALVQPYGAPLRRAWVQRHRVAHLSPPLPFPGAAVQVTLLVLGIGGGPHPLPRGMPAEELLRLDNAPLDPSLAAGDGDLVAAIRRESVPLGELCLVDTGVVAHRPGGSREALLFSDPGDGRVPYADAREFFAGRQRFLHYLPARMHRAKRPEMFERPKIVVQRVRGAGPVRAAVDRTGTYVGHTCTVICPHDGQPVPLERLCDLVRSPLTRAITRVERGHRLDLYPRDVAALPVPRAWLVDPAVPLAQAWALDAAGRARLEALID